MALPDYDAVGLNFPEREPSIDDTKIVIKDDDVRAQLMAKLLEYKLVYKEQGLLSARERIEIHGQGEYDPLFDEAILEALLTIAGEEGRDFSTHPITLKDIAMAVMEVTDFRLYPAMLTPFTYNRELKQFMPNEARLLWGDGNIESVKFSESYVRIRALAKNGVPGMQHVKAVSTGPSERPIIELGD